VAEFYPVHAAVMARRELARIIRHNLRRGERHWHIQRKKNQ